MKSIYAFEPKIYLDKKSGVYKVCYYNVALTDYLKEKSEMLLKEITYLPKELQRVFLRAFYDDEGCVNFILNYRKRQIRGYQHDDQILETIKKLLEVFKIKGSVDSRFHEIIIGRKENLIAFQKEINFSKGVAINPKRTNSVWGKRIEKREILAKAIQSYTT